jgi:metal-responsive CopG/Arc/MetJ family transcriptional regulator
MRSVLSVSLPEKMSAELDAIAEEREGVKAIL